MIKMVQISLELRYLFLLGGSMKKNIKSRNEEIETLLEIIRNKDFYKENSENGLVILLNGEWGSGKTTFIREFIGKIKLNKDIKLFNNYNAYENDYCENAYIPFFASIDDKIKLREEFINFIKSLMNWIDVNPILLWIHLKLLNIFLM